MSVARFIKGRTNGGTTIKGFSIVKHRRVLRPIHAALAASICVAAPVLAQGPLLQSDKRPPELPVEESDVAKLPPVSPSRLFLKDRGGLNVIDGTDPKLRSLGLIPISIGGSPAVRFDGSKIYVSETYYTHGNRGDRQDLVAAYDGLTLDMESETPLPGRLQAVTKAKMFDISEDGLLAYVYDMVPASAVHIVDINAKKVVGSVDLPGCALAFPVGARTFGSICGDGTIGLATIPTKGDAKVIFSAPFFDPDKDPVFEGSVADKVTGDAWFLTFTGKIFPANLSGSTPRIGKAWSVLSAAGLAEATTEPQQLAWRPGGHQPMALHRASKQLFVLMHAGNHWTHKLGGTEIWVLDTTQRRLVQRIKIGATAKGVAVSQGESPLLYALDADGSLIVFDATTGKELRKREISGDMAWVPGY